MSVVGNDWQYGQRRLTGGIMCAWCTHSICYGFHRIPRGEGRKDVFSAIQYPISPLKRWGCYVSVRTLHCHSPPITTHALGRRLFEETEKFLERRQTSFLVWRVDTNALRGLGPSSDLQRNSQSSQPRPSSRINRSSVTLVCSTCHWSDTARRL